MGTAEGSRKWLGVVLGVGLKQGVVRAIGAVGGREEHRWVWNLGDPPQSFKRAWESWLV